jgi:hypothetical protein
MRRCKARGFGIGMLLLAGLAAAQAQDPPQSPSLLADLEHRIEIGAHERLLKRRQASDAVLAPFRSDGCSGGLSAGWALLSASLPAVAQRHGDNPPWEHCCVAHDRVYHMAGPSDTDANASFEARRAADEDLRACVIKVGEDRVEALSATYRLSRDDVTRVYRSIADVMYRAVRLGGAPCSGLSWRWGFGWPHCD